MESLKFRVKNAEHSKAIQERLFELGYGWSKKDKTPRHLQSKYLFAHTGKYLTHDNYESIFINNGNKEVTLDYLYELQKEKRIQLNSEYEAIIKDNVVLVGCQEFSFDKIKELYKALKK